MTVYRDTNICDEKRLALPVITFCNNLFRIKEFTKHTMVVGMVQMITMVQSHIKIYYELPGLGATKALIIFKSNIIERSV